MDKDSLLLALNQRWQCDLDFGWVPITGHEPIADTEIYKSTFLEHYLEDIKSAIRNIFKSSVLFEIREDGQFRQPRLEDCDFAYNGLEYIYTNDGLDFVLYFSHEYSTTVGGRRLIDEIHKLWPEYSNHLWKSISE